MPLLPGPEQASDHPDSISTISELFDMLNNLSQEPPSPAESFISFSEMLASLASPKLEHSDSSTTYPHIVIDLTSPPFSPQDYFLTSEMEELMVNALEQSPKIRPSRDFYPECETKLPGPLPPNLLIRERIERCEVCSRPEVEEA